MSERAVARVSGADIGLWGQTGERSPCGTGSAADGHLGTNLIPGPRHRSGTRRRLDG